MLTQPPLLLQEPLLVLVLLVVLLFAHNAHTLLLLLRCRRNHIHVVPGVPFVSLPTAAAQARALHHH
jgi:hypothetical protein